VRGADSNNLAMTRQSQRDIWLHQMLPPRACQGRRLLLVPWSTGMYHGVGSQVHLMGAFLGLAMLYNRTLIPLANSFDRANHPHCQATGQQGAWECFFFPMVSPDCEVELNRLRAQDVIGDCVTGEELGYDRAAQSEQQAVCLDPTTDVFMSYEGRVAWLWGDAYLADADVVEHGGHVAPTSADTKMVRRGQVGQAVTSRSADLAREPYMQRPIVSMHVRQSDKLSEMRVLSLPAHMFLAYRLRHAMVDLRHVWLNTEAQSVINETAHYPDWHFLFATNARQPSDSERIREYDAAQSVAASLASLLIAAQCDVFIGSLGSNWSRLINELRATGGRLYSGFVAMNLGEW
ncbi:unnamed protein product, partial [Closterium sp. Yama58-4]